MALALAMPGEMNCGVLWRADYAGPAMRPTKRIASAAMAKNRLFFMALAFHH